MEVELWLVTTKRGYTRYVFTRPGQEGEVRAVLKPASPEGAVMERLGTVNLDSSKEYPILDSILMSY